MAWVQGRTHVFRWSSSSREPNERVDGVLIRGILFVDVQQVLAIEGVVTTLASPCLVQKTCLVFIVVRSDSAAEDGKDIKARGGCCQHIARLSPRQCIRQTRLVSIRHSKRKSTRIGEVALPFSFWRACT